MNKFKVVSIDKKITKAIGKKQNLLGLSDKKDTVIFIKNKFDYAKTNEKSIIKRLNSDLDIGKELNRFKDDLVVSLTDINAAHVVNSTLPTVDSKVLSGLVDLEFSLKKDKKSKVYLEKISDTQKKIYKVLSRIQEDLIDEQDTKIKDKRTQAATQKFSTEVEKPQIAKSSVDSAVTNKISNLLKNTSLKSVVRIAGKVLKVAEVILLLYYIAKNYNIADKSIDEPGIIEKIIFAVFGGVTEWVGTHLDMLSWLVDNFIEVCNWIKDHIEEYSSYLGGFDYLAKAIAYGIEYMPLKVICEYCLKPIFDWLKKNGEYGAPVGVYAVSIYRNFKANITNAVPNGKTYELLFGETKINEARKINVYNWDVIGKSQLRGSAKDLSKILTKQELEEILEHDDIDAYDVQKIKDALKLKETENISDTEISERRKQDTGLNSMIEKLMENIKFFDSAKEWKKLWLALAQNSVEFVKVNPEATVITYYTSSGKPATLNTQHLLVDNPYFSVSNSTEAPEALCKGIISEIKVPFVSDKEIFWFTPFGTVIIQQFISDPILSKKLVDKGIIKNHKLFRGRLGVVFKVVGFFDANFKFYKDVFNPADIVFKKIFKNNIITQSNLRHLNPAKITGETANVNLNDAYENSKPFKRLPSNLPSYVVNSYNQTYDDFVDSLPRQKIDPSETKKKVWDFFKKEFGMTDYQIAGIMGNLEVESRGFSSDVIQSEHMDRSKSGRNDGMSGGLCQWHDVGNSGRLTNLKKFARELGRDWRDLDVQLLYLKRELTTTHKSALDAVLKSTNVHEAAKAWVYKYEKPANKERETLKRAGIGHSFMDLYSNNVSTSTNQEFRIPMQLPENPNNVKTESNNNDILSISKNLITGTVYSQGNRTKEGYYDCSSFVTDVLKNMGFNVNGVPTTNVYGNTLTKIGFKRVGNASAYNQSNVQPGDILLKPGKHIMIYNGGGEVIEANGWNGNHNGINTWGSLHNKSDSYQVWRMPGITNLSNAYANVSNKPPMSVSTQKYSENSSKLESNTMSTNTNNIVIANNSVKDNYEYEGMSEELFNIKVVNV